MLNGVTRIDDAKRAVDAGETAISVSNHGGSSRTAPRPPSGCSADTARVVGDQVEVRMNGGMRRRGDVVKALALGVRAD